MTSEVIIVTNERICIGADDRKTVVNGKIFDGFEKIFPIAEDYPMVMMVNGFSHFAGESLEQLNKEFRCTMKNKKLSVKNVMENFIAFLENLNYGHEDIDKFINYHLFDFKTQMAETISQIPLDEFEFFTDNLETHEILPFLKDKNISFDDIIPPLIENNSEINEKLMKHFSHYIYNNSSEVIITGFDEYRKKPSIIVFRLFVKTKDCVEYEEIDYITDIDEGLILSFGDDGEIKLFLRGIDPYFEKENEKLTKYAFKYYLGNFFQFVHDSSNISKQNIDKLIELSKVFNDKNNDYLKFLDEEISSLKSSRYLPIFKITESLSDDDLIEFTIFLVRLTYYKRRYSFDYENVSNNVSISLLKKDKLILLR